MGQTKSTPVPKETSTPTPESPPAHESDVIIKSIHDHSSSGCIAYETYRTAPLLLEYSHPEFPALIRKLQVDKSYRIRFRFDSYVGPFTIMTVTDVPTVKITGSLVDILHNRLGAESKSKSKSDDPYAEVILDRRPVQLPGYDYYAVLLLEKTRLSCLTVGCSYEFTVSLFRGVNEFLIKDIECPKASKL